MDIIFEEIDRIREDIEHGAYILGNSEIDKLDPDMVLRVLQVKRSAHNILMNIKIALAGVYERDEINRDLARSLLLGALKEYILTCRHILPLMKMCNERLTKNIIG